MTEIDRQSQMEYSVHALAAGGVPAVGRRLPCYEIRQSK